MTNTKKKSGRGSKQSGAEFVPDSKVQGFIFVAIVVTWVIAMIVDVATDYEVPAPVTGLVTSIVGFYTVRQWKNGRSK